LRQVYAGFIKAVFLFEECAERQIVPGSISRVTPPTLARSRTYPSRHAGYILVREVLSQNWWQIWWQT
jgi:hypothetical protein